MSLALRKELVPLLIPHDTRHLYAANSQDRMIGIRLLIGTITIFIVSILLLTNTLRLPSFDPFDDLPIINYYSHALMLLPVGAWLWCVVAWTGLKLFKHAKGQGGTN